LTLFYPFFLLRDAPVNPPPPGDLVLFFLLLHPGSAFFPSCPWLSCRLQQVTLPRVCSVMFSSVRPVTFSLFRSREHHPPPFGPGRYFFLCAILKGPVSGPYIPFLFSYLGTSADVPFCPIKLHNPPFQQSHAFPLLTDLYPVPVCTPSWVSCHFFSDPLDNSPPDLC